MSVVGIYINHTSYFLYPNISTAFSGEFNISHFRALLAFDRSFDQSLSMIRLIVTHRPRDESPRRRPEAVRLRPKRSPTKHRHLFWQTPEIYECILFAHLFLADPLPFGPPSSCPLLLVLVRFQFLPFRLLSVLFFQPPSIFWLTLRMHTLIFFLATAWHKSSSRSTPKIRHSRLDFQRAYECTEILLIEVVLEGEIVSSSLHRQFSLLDFNYSRSR